jgi:phosphohistidine phosphatase
MQEHKLLIMRHAKSDWSADSGLDFDRPLATRGIKTAELMGKWLKKIQHAPDRVICSPALRAKQTCQLLLKELALAEHDVFWADEIYDASLNDLLSIIKQHSNNTRILLVIGHNPGLDQLVCHLSKETPRVNSSGKLMTTAALAILDYGSETITTEPHQAHLQSLIRPKELLGEE